LLKLKSLSAAVGWFSRKPFLLGEEDSAIYLPGTGVSFWISC